MSFDEQTGYAIIEAMAPQPLSPVGPATSLRDELMYDSLRLVELSIALEQQFDAPVLELGEAVDVTTAGDILQILRERLGVTS